MKRVFQSIALSAIVCFSSAFSCAQNGPTQPTVLLSWAQSTSPGIVANHVYRCTGAACIPAPPAIYGSTAPITAWTDTAVAANTTYVYAITASSATQESPYSNPEAAPVPAGLYAPVQNPPTEAKLEKLGPKVSSLQAQVKRERAENSH